MRTTIYDKFGNIVSDVVTDTVTNYDRDAMILTRVQAKEKLAEVPGRLEFIESEISKLPITHKMRIRWYEAQSFERLDPYLIEFCNSVLGMDDAGIDLLFTL